MLQSILAAILVAPDSGFSEKQLEEADLAARFATSTARFLSTRSHRRHAQVRYLPAQEGTDAALVFVIYQTPQDLVVDNLESAMGLIVGSLMYLVTEGKKFRLTYAVGGRQGSIEAYGRAGI